MTVFNLVLDQAAKHCLYHDKNETHECYSEFSLNDELYKINDYVVFKETGKHTKIGQLLCMFMDESCTFYTALKVEGMKKKESDCITEITSIIRKCETPWLGSDELNSNRKDRVLTEMNSNSPVTNIRSPLFDKTPGQNSTPVNYNDDLKDTSQEEERTVSTPRRNSVKRNLNKSFGDVHDYSIVEPAAENSLKVKLRKSMRQVENSPASSVRKSTRNIQRISYADYISPLKSRKKSVDEFNSPKFSERTSKVVRSLYLSEDTPKKNEVEATTPSRRRTKNVIDSKPVAGSVKALRSKRAVSYYESDNDEDDLCSPIETRNFAEGKTIGSVKALRSKRALSYYESDSDDVVDLSEPVESCLNESLRTHTLRINLDRLDVKDAKKRSEVCSDDKKQEAKAEISPPSTPRTRRNRLASITDCLDEPCPKTPRSKRNAKQTEKYSPTRPIRTPSTSTKTSISTRTPSISTKTPSISTRTPSISTRTPSISTRTPSISSRTPSISSRTPSKTPKNRAKLIRDGIITPSMQNRSKALQGDSTPLMKARSQLHVSYVPKLLPCREKEYADVYGFLQGKLLDRCGGCMYVSGVPGTGKTATVTSVITSLQDDKSVPKFTLVSINGMKLTEPRQSYVEIVKQLTGKSVPWEQAQNMLEDMFVKSKKQKPVIMLIDELDILCTKRQDVVYNLLDWPTKAKNQLIVITIANTMDLPERLLMSRVTSRLGLTRLTFQAYTYKQLQEIVTMRLTGTNTFNPDAVQFVARKVASVSGDARRALDICRRAAEIAEAEGKFELVNMNHVNEALNLMITQPKVQAIKHCSLLEQLILQSIVGEVERTGVEETNFAEVFKMLTSHAAIEGFKMVSTTVALTAVAKLGACRLILTDPKCNNIHQRIVLNVSADDVFYALRND